MADMNQQQAQELAKKTAEVLEKATGGVSNALNDHNKFGRTSAIKSYTFGGDNSAPNVLTMHSSPSTEKIDVEVGHYNTLGKANTDGLRQSVIDAGTAQFEEAEATQGKRKIDHAIDLSGVDSFMKSEAKFQVADKLYKDTAKAQIGKKQNLEKLSQDIYGKDVRKLTSSELENLHMLNGTLYTNSNEIKSIVGEKYIVGDTRTNNILKDYRTNMHTLEAYLEKNGINARNLSPKQIQSAFRKGELSHFYARGSKVDLTINSDLVKVLKEYGMLKSQEKNFQRAKGAGGLKNTAANWVKEGVKDSDAYTGYQTTKTTIKVGKTGLKAGKNTANATVNGTISAIQLGARVPGAAGQLTNGIAEKLTADSAKIAKYKEKAQKWKVVNENIRTGRTGVGKLDNLRPENVKVKITDGVKNTASKVGQKAYNAAPKQVKKGIDAGQKGINGIKNTNSRIKRGLGKFVGKITDNKIFKIIRAPFKGFSILKSVIKKIILGMAGGILLIIIIDGVLIAITEWVSPTSTESIDDNIANSNLQKMIDYLYSYQQAYTMNIYKAEKGSPYIAKGIPSTWKLTDSADVNSTDAVSDELTAIKSGSGQILGYNLSHYWGPADRIFEDTVQEAHYDGTDEDGDPQYSYTTETITIKDCIGGLEGDLGTYTEPGEYTMDKTSAAYLAMVDKINPNLTIEFEYFGSRYSYQLTSGKASSYITTDGDTITYDIEPFYKAFCSMAIGFTNNDPESFEFFSAYSKNIFDTVMENAKVTLNTTFEEDILSGSDETITRIRNTESNINTVRRLIDESAIRRSDFENEYYNAISDNDYLLADQILFDIEELDRQTMELQNNLTDLIRIKEERMTELAGTGHSVYWTYNDPVDGHTDLCIQPTWKANVTLKVWIDDCGLQDMIALDTADDAWAHTHGSIYTYSVNTPGSNYFEWTGWWEPDGETSEAQDLALFYYEMGEESFEDLFDGLTFPQETALSLSGEEITEIMDLIQANTALTPAREAFIEFALSCVGQYYYKYGSGHPIKDLNNPPAGLDCSGFVSYALFKGGADTVYTPRGCSILARCYTGVIFNGDFDNLAPGTIIVKNGVQGGTTTSSNHVVIYIGKLQLADDAAPRHYCVECTTTTNRATGETISGVQLSTPTRMQTIKNYLFARDPFFGR